jgi:hypothetical protein
MTELAKYESYYKKLEGICNENGLVFSFKKDQYPIRLTIKPTDGVGEQLTLLEMADEKAYMSPDAYLSFYIEDGELNWKTSRTFAISDTLFAKLRTLYKNMHLFWTQHFFRYLIEHGLDPRMMPSAKEPEVEPIEELEDEDELDGEVDIPDEMEYLLEEEEDDA